MKKYFVKYQQWDKSTGKKHGHERSRFFTADDENDIEDELIRFESLLDYELEIVDITPL